GRASRPALRLALDPPHLRAPASVRARNQGFARQRPIRGDRLRPPGHRDLRVALRLRVAPPDPALARHAPRLDVFSQAEPSALYATPDRERGIRAAQGIARRAHVRIRRLPGPPGNGPARLDGRLPG